MNFELTKQQEMVRTTLRRFAQTEVQPLAAEVDATECFPRQTVEKMAKPVSYTHLPNLRVTNAVVFQNGQLVGECHILPEHRRNVYSASKSFTGAAVGIAQREGLLSIDERVCDCFCDYLPTPLPPQLEALTLKHLLTMSAGQDAAYLMAAERNVLGDAEWISYALSRPFVTAPGEAFLYTNISAYLLGQLVQMRAGCTLLDYLVPRLFLPLHIYRPTWETDPKGNTFGAGGLFLTATELARFGQLYLQNGMWEGKQLVPADWVRQSTSKQIQTPYRADAQDWSYGYGCLLYTSASVSCARMTSSDKPGATSSSLVANAASSCAFVARAPTTLLSAAASSLTS